LRSLGLVEGGKNNNITSALDIVGRKLTVVTSKNIKKGQRNIRPGVRDGGRLKKGRVELEDQRKDLQSQSECCEKEQIGVTTLQRRN